MTITQDTNKVAQYEAKFAELAGYSEQQYLIQRGKPVV